VSRLDQGASFPRLILDREFEDMGTYAETLGGWDFDFRQLDAGRLRAAAAVLTAGPCAALRVKLNRGFHQVGAAPPAFWTFGMPDESIRWLGIETGRGQLINFNRADGFEGTSRAGFSGYVLLAEERFLREVAADRGVELDEASVREPSVWSDRSGLIDELSLMLRSAFREANGNGAAGSLGLDRWCAERLVTVLATSEVTRSPEPTTRALAVRRALEILEEPLRLPLKVLDLCETIGVSAPTLYRAFMQEFGVSPKRYIQIRSLSGVRKHLLEAESGTLVGDVANRWGYWHMGQFAADYRRQFGELPSGTLGGKPSHR
jgi:AraC-like DNA-binding protein